MNKWTERLVTLLAEMAEEYDAALPARLRALWVAVQARAMRHNFDRARSPDLWFSMN